MDRAIAIVICGIFLKSSRERTGDNLIAFLDIICNLLGKSICK